MRTLSLSINAPCKPIGASVRRSLTNIKIMLVLLFFYSSNSYAQKSSLESISLFDGKSLNGWKAVNPSDRTFWSVVDSVIIFSNGGKKIESNTYLQTEKEYGDFEFRCLFRLSGDHNTGMINSGIQYRSNVVDGKVIGYQADIGKGYWGDLYDEHRRGKLAGGVISTLRHVLNEDGWNSFIIRVKGNHHELYINGVKTCNYLEKDPKIPARGVIALQIHKGGVAKVEFRDITITNL